MAERSYPPKLYPSRMEMNNPYEVTIGKRFDFEGGYYQRLIIDGVEQSLLIDTEKDPELDLSGYQVGDAVTIVRAKSGDDPWGWKVNGENKQQQPVAESVGTVAPTTSPLPSTHSRVAVSDVALIYLEHIEAIKWAHGEAGLGDVPNDAIATLAMTMMNKSMSDYSVLPKGHGEEANESSGKASKASGNASKSEVVDDDLPF
jgi:hypothetical protein